MPNATDVAATLELALKERELANRAERLAAKGPKANAYVSDVGKCSRAVVMSLLGVEETNPVTVDSLINFAVGHAAEAWFGGLLGPIGTFEAEKRVEFKDGDDVLISGRGDFVIGDDTIVELKTTSSRAMNYLLKENPNGRPEHRRQLNLYLAALGKRNGVLIYIIKDAVRGEPSIHAFDVPLDEAKAGIDIDILGGLVEIARRASPEDDLNDIAPIPEGYKRSKYPCSYCPYQSTCWS